MRTIKDLDKIINMYADWKPSDVAFVKFIEWFGGALRITVYSQLRQNGLLWPDLSKEFFESSLYFHHVTNMKIEFTGVNVQQISGFDILDISGNGQEKKNFFINDHENGTISFYCEDIEIESASQPFKLHLDN